MVAGLQWDTIEAHVMRLRNRYYIMLDALLLPLAAYLAFVLRLEAWDLGRYWPAALVAMALALLVKIPIFMMLGGHSRYWPFASLPELELLLIGALLGEFTAIGLNLMLAYLAGYPPMPRSVPFIELLLAAAALAGPRLAARLVHTAAGRSCAGETSGRESGNGAGVRTLIAGAGEGGNLVLQEIQRNPQLGLRPVGFVDDDPAKQGLVIRRLPVLGAIEAIPNLVQTYRVQQVLIAIPTATGDQMRRIVELCRAAGIEALTLPGIFELISGRVEIQRFRPVRVEDLLAREPVQTDMTGVRDLLQGQVVLVTGAGGSIGSELCRQIADCRPAAMVLVGHGENSIYQIHKELARTTAGMAPPLDLFPVIADIRDADRLDRIFDHFRPAAVFHAAAHKHVPLMEANPEEAVTNNVGGTRNLLRAAERYEVGAFVMISTDKAVNPTSVMGATKRIAEQLVQAAAHRSGRRFVAVRFGNVLGSRGSVVPLFQAQIEAGGPVTVTHPEVERYFMTIPEAVQLVLQAAALGEGGEVFVLDMGKPVKIVDLAKDMIRLAGLEEGRDVKIAFTGLRPGEKLFEEIFLDDEHYGRTVHQKIFVSRNGKAPEDQVAHHVELLLRAAEDHDQRELYRLIRCLAPACAETLGESRAVVPARDMTMARSETGHNGADLPGSYPGAALP